MIEHIWDLDFPLDSVLIYVCLPCLASSIHSTVKKAACGPIKQQLAAGTNQAAVISTRIIPGPRPENPPPPPGGLERREPLSRG